jgi:unsaturated rhamnogalacturonyl hydrolase
MFVYAMAKGIRKGYLCKNYVSTARRGFEGVLEHLVEVDGRGLVNLHGICQGAGLGGEPYRDGSYEYYISEPTRLNDCKGVGPFILAGIEMERIL